MRQGRRSARLAHSADDIQEGGEREGERGGKSTVASRNASQLADASPSKPACTAQGGRPPTADLPPRPSSLDEAFGNWLCLHEAFCTQSRRWPIPTDIGPRRGGDIPPGRYRNQRSAAVYVVGESRRRPEDLSYTGR